MSRVRVTWVVEYEADWLPETDDDKKYAVEDLMDEAPGEIKFKLVGDPTWTPVGWSVNSPATGELRLGTLTDADLLADGVPATSEAT